MSKVSAEKTTIGLVGNVLQISESSNRLDFSTPEVNTFFTRLSVFSNGSVSIGTGTSSPTSELRVDGDLYIYGTLRKSTTAVNIQNSPSGVICMWSGLISAIPSGWLLCNGTNGTPDLRDRFVQVVSGNVPLNSTGGSSLKTSSSGGGHVSHTVSSFSEHTHSHTLSGVSSNGHTHSVTGGLSASDHTHSLTSVGSFTVTQAYMGSHDNEPSIAVWGLDSSASGTRIFPNGPYQEKQSASYGGSSSHTHGNGTSSSAGAHTHTATVSEEDVHTHTFILDESYTHTHSLIGGVDPDGVHTHTFEALPEFYSLAFIMKG